MARHDPDRLLAQNPFRHFRRTYSLKEVKLGVCVLLVLVAITAWISWMGKKRPPELYGAVELSGGKPTEGSVDSSAAAIVPAAMLGDAWLEAERSEFDESNLYEKINGRADFFTSKGFERLFFVSLAFKERGSLTLDLELYDMGSPAGALSAFTAERKDGVDVVETPTSQHYTSRNAMFLAKGKYYARALGADESAEVLTALDKARVALEGALTGNARAWALELYVDGLGFDAGKVTFVGERAFSLEAARAMWIAALEGDAEIFVSSRRSEQDAVADAKAITAGFASYGSASETEPVFVTDEFLGAVSVVSAHRSFVIGVRAATDVEAAKTALATLQAGIDKMSPELLERAKAAAIAPGAAVSDGDAAEPGEPEPGGETEPGSGTEEGSEPEPGSETQPGSETEEGSETEPGGGTEETY